MVIHGHVHGVIETKDERGKDVVEGEQVYSPTIIVSRLEERQDMGSRSGVDSIAQTDSQVHLFSSFSTSQHYSNNRLSPPYLHHYNDIDPTHHYTDLQLPSLSLPPPSSSRDTQNLFLALPSQHQQPLTTMTFFRITLIRSAIGLPSKSSGVLRALGLRKRMRTVFHPVIPEVAGQIMKVKELVAISEVEQAMTKMELRDARRPEPGFWIESAMPR